MREAEIIEYVERLGDVVALRPTPGDGTPEIAWGDTFFYYSPDGSVPQGQPFATIVTKDYPGDERSRLDRDGAFRVNVAAGRDPFVRALGSQPGEPLPPDADPSQDDVLLPHPVYGALAWVAVVNPGPCTEALLRDLLRTAHALARGRRERRAGAS
jgi:hypothetical protein